MLAKKIGIAPSHMSHIENGVRGMSTGTLRAILQALEIEIWDVWDTSDKSTPPIALQTKNSIILEKTTKVFLPATADNYKMIVSQIIGENNEEDFQLIDILTKLSRASDKTRDKIQKILNQDVKD